MVTIDAVDASGSWGSITLRRGEDAGGYPGAATGDFFFLEVFVDYEATRLPDPEQFGASDWSLRPTDPDAEHFFVIEPVNSRAGESVGEGPGQLLGQYPGAVDILTTPTEGWVVFQVARRESNLELELVYGNAGGAETTTIPVRIPAAAPTTNFTPTPNAEADALFADRDTCSNPGDGFAVNFPDSWYTNTEIGNTPACSWFSPEFFEVDDPDIAPDEIQISIGMIDSALGYTSLTDVLSSEEGVIGGRTARRVEFNSDPVERPGYRAYHYVILLGGSQATGPTFVAHTDNEMASDFSLAKAVLDRIMATLVMTDPTVGANTFTPAPNDPADALLADRNACINARGGYVIDFPASLVRKRGWKPRGCRSGCRMHAFPARADSGRRVLGDHRGPGHGPARHIR